MLIDSHCHLDQLDLKDFDDNLEKALDLAKQNGVTHMLNVCIDLNNFPNVLHIAKQHSNIYASVGVHPNEFDLEEPTVEELIKLGQDEKIIAIGETGLDYYRTEEDKIKRQKQRFSNHIQVAKTLQKPLIIHTRQARVDTLDILRVEKADEIAGVMHCFTEDWLTAKQAMDLNFYISISGILTFKNAQELRDVVKM
ncbi:MAG: TatD family hydrolase, partial [Gammaproteobacteria bacterium]